MAATGLGEETTSKATVRESEFRWDAASDSSMTLSRDPSLGDSDSAAGTALTSGGTSWAQRLLLTLKQVLAALVLSQTNVVFGVLIAFGSLFVSSSETGEHRHWTTDQVTWVLSAPSIGSAIGCLLAAPLTNRLGALRVIVWTSALNLTAWFALCFGHSVAVLVVGRALSGMFVGLNVGNCRIYIAEVSNERLRGVLCHLPAVSISAAFLGCFSLAGAVPWRYAVLGCGCLPTVIHLAGALLLPQSARWLLASGGSRSDAERSITFYRGKQHDVSGEINQIQKALGGEVRSPTLLRQVRRLVTEWDCAKPVLLLCGQFVFDAFCGGMTITQFAPMIFRRAVPRLDPRTCTILLAAVQLMALCGSGVLVRRISRRAVLAAAGSCGAAGCLLVAVALIYPTIGEFSWIPLAGVLLANAAAQAGITPVSFLYFSELLPAEIRPLVGNCFVIYISAMNLSAVHLFPVATAALGTHGVFIAVAGLCGVQVAYALLLLPETKDLSLEEVQYRHFSSKRRWGGSRSNGTEDCEASTEKPPIICATTSK